jgi:hypothetical protein
MTPATLVTGSMDNIRRLIGHRRFELIRHDVRLPLYKVGFEDGLKETNTYIRKVLA